MGAGGRACGRPQTDPNAVVIPRGQRFRCCEAGDLYQECARGRCSLCADGVSVRGQRADGGAGGDLHSRKITHVQRAGRMKGRSEI